MGAIWAHQRISAAIRQFALSTLRSGGLSSLLGRGSNPCPPNFPIFIRLLLLIIYSVFKDLIFLQPLGAEDIWADIVSENCQLSLRFFNPLS